MTEPCEKQAEIAVLQERSKGVEASIERIDANGLNQAARDFLIGHGVNYYVTVKNDAIFEKRDKVVDQTYFSEVYSDSTSAIYQIK